MKYPLWFYWQFYVALILAVYAICRAFNSRFLLRRVVYGSLALIFDAHAFWLVIRAIWEDEGCIVLGAMGWSIMITPFALLGVLFAWRFAVWHQKAISNQDTTK
jgi:hypothetical protein